MKTCEEILTNGTQLEKEAYRAGFCDGMDLITKFLSATPEQRLALHNKHPVFFGEAPEALKELCKMRENKNKQTKNFLQRWLGL